MSNHPIEDYTLTAEDVSEMLNYNLDYVRQAAHNGTLPAIKRIRQWFFCQEELEELLRSKKPLSKDLNESENDNKGDNRASNFIR